MVAFFDGLNVSLKLYQVQTTNFFQSTKYILYIFYSKGEKSYFFKRILGYVECYFFSPSETKITFCIHNIAHLPDFFSTLVKFNNFWVKLVVL